MPLCVTPMQMQLVISYILHDRVLVRTRRGFSRAPGTRLRFDEHFDFRFWCFHSRISRLQLYYNDPKESEVLEQESWILLLGPR